jgi:hypothetical protein
MSSYLIVGYSIFAWQIFQLILKGLSVIPTPGRIGSIMPKIGIRIEPYLKTVGVTDMKRLARRKKRYSYQTHY